jgi:hypothetical protein
MKIACLADGVQSSLSTQLKSVAEESGIRGVFNPSLRSRDGLRVIAFRGFLQGADKEVRAWLLKTDAVGSTCQLIDLTTYFKRFGVGPTADPKLFALEGEIFLTFNTGWAATENRLFISQVTPELGEPLECIYQDRQSVEKNWAFFGSQTEPRALYSLNTGLILQGHLNQQKNQIEFEAWKYAQFPKAARNLSIGTQFLENGREMYFIAHRKLSLLGKRMYVGLPLSLDVGASELRIVRGSRYLIHSVSSLFGSRVKLNKNLISCTYFSGIDEVDGKIILSYGVNDTAYGFAGLDRSAFHEN